MKILVTGGAGFIGSFLVDALIEGGHNVAVLDNLEPQVHWQGRMPPYFNKAAEFMRADIRDYDEVRKAVRGKDAVYHLAAAVGIGQSQYEIKRYTGVNTGGTANLLQAVLEEGNKIKKLILTSSMSTYGEGSYTCGRCGVIHPESRKSEDLMNSAWEMKCGDCGGAAVPAATGENSPLHCNSIYSLTKKNQEEMCLNFSHTYGLSFKSLRLFNVFGPRQSLSNPYTGVAAIFLSRLKSDRPPVIYEDGGQTRDFVSVHDVVGALVLCLTVDSDKSILNIGRGEGISISRIAAELSHALGKDIAPDVSGRYRKGDIRHCFADISLAKEILGYSPRVDLKSGLCELIKWSESGLFHDYFDRYQQELIKRKLLV